METLDKILDEKPKSRIMRVFKSTIGTCQYPFGAPQRAGKIAHFINGEFLTDDAIEIQELENEIRLGHPHIYIDDKKRQIDILADPLQAVRDRAVADYIAAQEKNKEKALNKENVDVEDAKAGKNTGIGTTANVGTMIRPPAPINSSSDPKSAVTAGNASITDNNPEPLTAPIEPEVPGAVNAKLADLAARIKSGQIKTTAVDAENSKPIEDII